jgi:DNA-binding PadR family transcriptional regulator
VAFTRRPSAQTVAVLRALSDQPTTWRYGYELVSQLGINSGSLYPILMRLTDRGLLEADWETDGRPGRPARHLYRITATGLDFVAALPSTVDAPPRRWDSMFCSHCSSQLGWSGSRARSAGCGR